MAGIEDTFSEGTVEGVDSVGDGALCLAVSTGGPIESYELADKAELVIGRSSSADVRIDDPSVSRRHALIRRHEFIEIQDLGSSNGVRVNGTPLTPRVWSRLRIGESAEVGNALVVLRPRAASRRPRRVWSHGYFSGRVEEECARSARTGAEFGVLRIGLPAGLAAVDIEDVLAGWLRAADVLARYAANEYSVLYLDLAPGRAEVATHRLVGLLTTRLDCTAADIRIGLSCFPRDGRSAEALFTRSNDLAMGRQAGNDLMGLSSLRPDIRDQIERVAASSLSVLILGETGVGKEVCAKTMHALSPRSSHKLLTLNCAALPDTLLESELFGHEKGAFTGAMQAKPGLLESADGGTVFLDEIGELPLMTQVKLLRVLEQRQVQRIGALDPIDIDVRFLAATNRDLDSEVASGRFRQDLLFRLNAVTLRIEPLRERRSEIIPLANHFLEVAAADLGLPTATLTEAVVELLLAYPWPGNVRELRNMMERAVVLSGGDHIDPAHLPLDQMQATVLPASVHAAARIELELDADDEWRERPTGPIPRLPKEIGSTLRDDVAEIERQRIIEALDVCGGNQSRAAKMLGVSRGTLIKRIDSYGLTRPRKNR